MAREIVESVKIVIKTESGNRLEWASEGSATSGMLMAFTCLSVERQERLLRKMWENHQKQLKARADAAAKEG